MRRNSNCSIKLNSPLESKCIKTSRVEAIRCEMTKHVEGVPIGIKHVKWVTLFIHYLVRISIGIQSGYYRVADSRLARRVE